MEAYATALTYAIPGFITLIVLEYLVSRWMGRDVANSMDTIASLSSGMTNTLKDVAGLSITIVSYSWMVKNFGIFDIQSSLALYILAFVLIDFAGYWSHRFNHEINLFWNRHIVHHSSEEFNLSCALRQSISAIIGVYFFLYIPMAIIGVPTKVVAITAPIQLFAQFWYHTRLIGRMGILEHIIVTPSHHRVHHAINPEYIDKNYAQVFIIWDKLFGTFQEELPDVPAVYGVKKAVSTWNPFLINWQHTWRLIQDAWRTKSWNDKLRIWWMPTGWRPQDVAERYPIAITEDPYSQKKYMPYATSGLKYWSWFQLVFFNLMLYYILVHIADFRLVDIFSCLGFIAVSIFSYTSLMDRDFIAVPMEIAKVIIGFVLIARMGGWYRMDEWVFDGATYAVAGYLIVSLVVTGYYSFYERPKLVTA